MPAPSRRTGIPATFVGLALTVILVAGFALGPRAFEFSAWPQPSQGGAVEQVVTRSSDGATEVPVARVRRGERKRARGRDGALSVRGRNGRGDRMAARGVTLDARSRGTDFRRRPSGRDGGSDTAPPAAVSPDEIPAPAGEQPAEQSAQLAEAPPAEPAEQVLRPDVEELGRVPDNEPQVRSDGFLDEFDHLADALLADESRHGRHGRR